MKNAAFLFKMNAVPRMESGTAQVCLDSNMMTFVSNMMNILSKMMNLLSTMMNVVSKLMELLYHK